MGDTLPFGIHLCQCQILDLAFLVWQGDVNAALLFVVEWEMTWVHIGIGFVLGV